MFVSIYLRTTLYLCIENKRSKNQRDKKAEKSLTKFEKMKVQEEVRKLSYQLRMNRLQYRGVKSQRLLRRIDELRNRNLK